MRTIANIASGIYIVWITIITFVGLSAIKLSVTITKPRLWSWSMLTLRPRLKCASKVDEKVLIRTLGALKMTSIVYTCESGDTKCLALNLTLA